MSTIEAVVGREGSEPKGKIRYVFKRSSFPNVRNQFHGEGNGKEQRESMCFSMKPVASLFFNYIQR